MGCDLVDSDIANSAGVFLRADLIDTFGEEVPEKVPCFKEYTSSIEHREEMLQCYVKNYKCTREDMKEA